MATLTPPQVERIKGRTEEIWSEFQQIKTQWEDLRTRAQALHDETQAIVNGALKGDGDVEDAIAIQDADQKAGTVRHSMENMWWDKRRGESTID